MALEDILLTPEQAEVRNQANITNTYNSYFGGQQSNITPESLESSIMSSTAFKGYKDNVFDNNQVQVLSMPTGSTAKRLPSYIPGMDMEDFYAKNQSVSDSIENGILGGFSKFFTKMLTGVGYLAGLAGIDNHHEDYGNWVAGAGDNALTQYGKKMEAKINDEWNPIYQEAGDRNKGFFWRAAHDLNFWTQDGTDALAFMASAWVPAAMLRGLSLGVRAVKGLAALRGVGIAEEGAIGITDALSGSSVSALNTANNFGKLSKWISNAKIARGIDVATTSLINTPSEAMFEGQSTKEDVLAAINADPLLSKLPEEEKLKRAGLAASNVFKANLVALAASNLFEANLMFKRLPLSSVEEDLAKRATKEGLFGTVDFAKEKLMPKLWNITKDVAKGYGTEGLYEENIQLAIQRINTERALDINGFGTGKHRSVVGQYFKQTKDAAMGNDPEAAVSIGMGGLIGGGEVMLSSIRDHIGENKRLDKIKTHLNQYSNAFNTLGSIYQKEEITQPDGSTIQRLKLNEEGKPIVDEEKLKAVAAEHSNILEWMDLAHIAEDGGKKALQSIYEGELFGKFAEAHFQAGLGSLLMEKLNDLGSLSEKDLNLLGYDGTSKEQAQIKLEQYKQRAANLQTAWNGINENILPSSNSEKDQNIAALRKSELFRLFNRKFSIQDIESEELNNHLNLQNQISAVGNIINPIATQANLKKAKAEQAEKHFEQLHNDLAFQTSNIDFDTEDIKDAFKEKNKAKKEYEEFLQENEESLKNNPKDEEGWHKEADTFLLQKDLKISALKQAELSLSLNSINSRIDRLSDPRSGNKYFDVHQDLIRESANPIATNSRLDIRKKSLQDYLSYEIKKLRRHRIISQFNNINSEHTSQAFGGKISSLSYDEITEALKTLNETPLSKEVIEALIKRYTKLSNDKIDAIDEQLSSLSKELEDAEEEDPDTGEMVVESKIEERIQKEKQDLNNEKQTIENNLSLLSSLKEHIIREVNDNESRRSIAEEYFQDADYLIKGISQTSEGFDTQKDLDAAQKQLDLLKKLKEFTETREDGVEKSKEFEGFIEKIEDKISKLEDIVKTINERIVDRKLKDEKVKQNTIRDIALSIGINSDTKETNKVFDKVAELISIFHKDVFDATIKKLFDTSSQENSNEYIGHLNTLTDLLTISYRKATSEQKTTFNEDVNKDQEVLLNSIKENSLWNLIYKYTKITKESFVDLYSKNPAMAFISFLGNLRSIDPGAGIGNSSSSVYESEINSPAYDFFGHKDLRRFQEDSRKDEGRNKDNSEATKEEVDKLLEEHIKYVQQKAMLSNIKNNITILPEVENEIAIIEEGMKNTKSGIFAPSNQQIRALREIVSFFYIKKNNSLLSAFAYLKGPAGTGKSSVLGKWLPKLLRIKQDEIFALGTDASSSKTINNIIGKDIVPSFEELIAALERGDKLKLILLDEVGKLGAKQLNLLAQTVQKYNEGKDDQVKIILLGDPNQMNINDEGNLVQIPAIEQFTLSDPEIDKDGNVIELGNANFNITNISPLTIRYRSNVAEVSSFADKFIGNNNNVQEEEFIVKSNNPSLDENKISTGLLGVVGTLGNFNTKLLSILKNTDFDDNKTRAIITNPEKIEKYKQLLVDNKIDLTKVEVISFVEAQGRTIDEVYIDINKEGELKDSDSFYNKALYVATSRATNFVLINNLNTSNEKDENIEESADKNETDVNEAPAKFSKDRRVEQDTELANLKDLEKEVKEGAIKNAPQEKPEEKPNEKTPPTEAEEEEEEIVPEDQPIIPDSEKEDGEIDSNPLARIQEKIRGAVDSVKHFIHTLAFPSSEATKNLTEKDGDISDKVLEKLAIDGKIPNILSPSIKANDVVYYVPIRGDNGQAVFVIITPFKNKNGQIEEGKYRQVGVMGEKEINDLRTHPSTKIIADNIDVFNNSTNKTWTVGVSLNKKIYTNVKNVATKSIATGVIENIQHLTFDYSSVPSNLDLNATIKTFIKGFFGAEYENNPAVLSRIQSSARIVIYKKEEASKIYGVTSGIPYLVLSDLKSPDGLNSKPPKEMRIALDRKVLNNKIHADFLNPLISTISEIKKLNNLLPEGFKYGIDDYRNLLKGIISNKVGEVKISKKDGKIVFGEGESIFISQEMLDGAQKIINSYETQSTNFKKGSLVHSKNPETDKLFQQKNKANNNLLASGATITAIVSHPDNDGTPIQYAKLRYYKKEGDVISIVNDEKEYPLSELEIREYSAGPAQKVLNKLWVANQANIKKSFKANEDFPYGKTDATNTSIEAGPSLISSSFKGLNGLNFWDNFLQFDTEGNHVPNIQGAVQFRIPISMRFKREGTVISFNKNDSNVLAQKGTEILDYYIQSSFTGISPTQISVVFNKEVSLKQGAPIEAIVQAKEEILEENLPKTEEELQREKLESILNTVEDDEYDDDVLPGRQASKERYATTELGKALSEKEIINMLSRFFPKLSKKELKEKIQFVSEVEMLHLAAGREAWGLFKNNVIYLKSNPDGTIYSKVARHEAFHMIFNNYLTTEERNRFIETMLKENPSLSYLTKDQLDEYVDEYGADRFMSLTPLRNIHYYLKLILQKIGKLFNFVYNNIESFDALFSKIENGTIGERYTSLDGEIDKFITRGMISGLIKTNCK